MISPQNRLLPDRINQLLTWLTQGVYEREDTVKLCLLAALSGESVFLLGPPGIGKSMIARRLIMAFENSRFFDYLMTRFSTPEEVFGPLSIKALKDEGRFERLTDGYLPDAQVVFLDEIWKAGPAILNSLLTVINERIYRNGQQTLSVPLRALITASNELPASGSGLDALYDRFLIRLWLEPIRDKRHFRALLLDKPLAETNTTPPESLDCRYKISQAEYDKWLQEMEQINVPEDVFELLFDLKTKIEQHPIAANVESGLYVSDRRWKKALKLIKASAFFNGRDQVHPLDLLLLKDCLWGTLESREVIYQLVHDCATKHAFNQTGLQQQAAALTAQLIKIQADFIKINQFSIEQQTSLRKPLIEFGLANSALRSAFGYADMLRFAILKPNQGVADDVDQQRDCLSINVRQSDLEKNLKPNAEAEILSYIDNYTTPVRLNFELDENGRLWVGDNANHPLPLGRCNQKELTETLAKVQTIKTAFKNLQLEYQRNYHHFRNGLPHLFILSTRPATVEQSFTAVLNSMVDAQAELDKIERHLLQMNEQRMP